MPATRADHAANTGWRLAMGAAAWPVGAACQLHEAALQPATVYAVCMALGVLLILPTIVWPAIFRRRQAAAGVGLGFGVALGTALGLALLAYGVTGGRASARLADALPATLEARELQITGVVASLPQRTANGLRFRFEVEQAMLGGEAVAVPSVVSLGWYHGFDDDATLSAAQLELRAGQRWRFTARLRRPHGLANPHGVDQELRWFEEGVRATGSVRDAPAPQLIDRAAAHPVERLRQRARDAIDAAVPEPRVAGVLTALAVGDQSAIERDDWELFRRSGISHLVSVSGVHVTMFGWLAGVLVGAGWRRSVSAMAWVPAPTAALWGGFGVALAYAVFSGWGVPAQRTVWMLGAVTLLRSAGVRWPWPLVLLIAADVVTLVDPWALLQPGFWLSFAAVGLLMVSGQADATPPEVAPRGPDDLAPGSLPAWRRALATVRGAAVGGVRTQLVATLGLAPLTLVFFQQLSLIGFVANLVAIPLVTLVITPLALLGCLVPLLWSVAAAAVSLLTTGLGWLASAPGVLWSVGVAPWWAQAAGLLGAVLLVMPLPWRLRALALPLAWPLCLPPQQVPPPGQFELVAVDVGQGTAVLVRTHRHLLVYDSGPQYAPDVDAGQRVLLPLLRARGDHRIDTLMLSHRDSDHVGGASSLLQSLPIAELTSSIEDAHPVRLQAQLLGVAPRRCAAGQRWEWDGVRFEVLHPAADDYASAQRSNAMSCVLRVEGASGVDSSVLLTGDIEREQEIRLLRERPEALRSAVLIVPHHGSKTSSTAAFLDAVAPRVAVFQAGHLNRYGHPAGEVMARYRERNIARIDSPSCGAWTWRSGVDRGAQPALCQRAEARRYWHWRPDPLP
jgi:competence protein ComEC